MQESEHIYLDTVGELSIKKPLFLDCSVDVDCIILHRKYNGRTAHFQVKIQGQLH